MTRVVLGLDLGEASIGWAYVKYSGDTPVEILKTGVRLFPAGMEGDIESGKGESHATARRNARQIRRQIARRAMRKTHVHRWLTKWGLLPQGPREKVIPQLDLQLIDRYKGVVDTAKMQLAQILPYWLRARALDQPLTEEELGRVFFHLAQRRGFLSNRKSPQKPDEEDGVVKGGIVELAKGMQETHARTLGEYFASLNPHEKRIRVRYTHRDMFLDEFEQIWAAQQPHHPTILTEENHDLLKHALFHQRRLKSAKHLIGKCDLEPTCPKASYATLDAQRFRLLQTLNNLQMMDLDTGEVLCLSAEQRQSIYDLLDTKGDQTWPAVKKVLGHKAKEVQFNLEEGGEKKIPGNRIVAKMVKVFGDAWFGFTEQKQEAVIHDVRSIRLPEVLEAKAKKAYNLDTDSAQMLAEMQFEPGYCSLSSKAIRRCLPGLQEGKHFATVRKELYGEEKLSADEPMEWLPPVSECFDIRNPIVSRALTELRHLVNHLMQDVGRPDVVKIELARNIKQSAKRRQDATKKNRANQKLREAAAAAITEQTGIAHPSRDDILKYQLAAECNWQCPYTGDDIGIQDLFGASPKFDIEHIIPYSRSFDDSFMNKTLCQAHENRHVKKNQTPYEAYHQTQRWDSIVGAVQRFIGPGRNTKLRRFTMTPDELSTDEFISRQLVDTAYASKLAAEYMGTLYGGQIDADHKRRVFPVAGRVTAMLRREWSMNEILSDDYDKCRDDHRHHAIDAVAIALTTQGMIQQLTAAALPYHERRRHRGRFQPIALPWDGFREDLQQSIDAIHVSHRPSHIVSGQLHEETNYGRPRPGTNGKYTIRRELVALKINEVAKIVDLRVRKCVQDKLAELKQTDPAKAFAEPANHPTWITNEGQTKVIHRVRVAIAATPKALGKEERERLTTTKTNHHMEIFAHLDDEGNITKWDAKIVDLLEAYRRKNAREPIVQRDHGPNTKFLFSLFGRDTLQLRNPGDWPEFLVVRSLSSTASGGPYIAGVDINDARMKKDIQAAKEFRQIASAKKLASLNPQKVIVLPNGEIRNAND